MRRGKIAYWATVLTLCLGVLMILALLYFRALKEKTNADGLGAIMREAEEALIAKQVSPGMSEDQVIRVMGAPAERWQPADTAHFDLALIYPMKTSKDAIMVTFRGGNALGTGRFFSYSESAAARSRGHSIEESSVETIRFHNRIGELPEEEIPRAEGIDTVPGKPNETAEQDAAEQPATAGE